MFNRLTILFALALCVPPLASARAQAHGAVYALTNAAEDNAVAIYARAADGTLSFREYVPTDGKGSGGEEPLEPVDALGSQGALVLSGDARWLYAVNAGSDDISLFRVEQDSLTLTDRVPSQGAFPASLAVRGDLVYVLNAGGEGNLTGFRRSHEGALLPLSGSTRSLDVGGDNPPRFIVSPGQIGFDPSGDNLVVTIKGSNEIRVFPMGVDGRPAAHPVVSRSAGTAPFGFGFDRHQHLIVVEPFGQAEVGTGHAGAVSSYDIEGDGKLRRITTSEPNGQTATCWLAATRNGRFAYATNNGSSTVSAYRVSSDGRLSLIDGEAGHSGDNPVDLGLTRDGRFLYTVNAGAGTLSAFAVDPASGSLRALGEIGGLPVHDGAVGIAVR